MVWRFGFKLFFLCIFSLFLGVKTSWCRKACTRANAAEDKRWTWQKMKFSGDHEEMKLGEDVGPEEPDGFKKNIHPSLSFRLGLAPTNGKQQLLCRFLLGVPQQGSNHASSMTARLAHREAAWSAPSSAATTRARTARQSCAATQSGRPSVAVSGVESLGTEGGVVSSLVGQRKLKEQTVLDPPVFAFLTPSKATVVCAFNPNMAGHTNQPFPAMQSGQVGATVSQLTGGSCLPCRRQPKESSMDDERSDRGAAKELACSSTPSYPLC
ncbi:hypothetical protein MAPG_11392 [Magnaporthiopsis poae ATCC 64411]|uniref:Uncharacterized protein n=1 Tax=Magnaporthiopsis poae (strain ATCC 64411 / 73-15) TaxID=644358 RepID=A0A0C4EF58_MAGP6|nr:hypothetical protein MAPG_11392 [Magnaporthiopsis poae ATCC 64411]